MHLAAELLVDARNAVGESPVWNADEQALYWVDIDGACVLRLAADGTLRRWSLPEKIGCIARHRQGGWIGALRSTVRRLQFGDDASAAHEELAQVVHAESPMRFNDGRCDRQGRFWVGSMFEDTSAGRPAGVLYRYTAREGLRASGIDGLVVSNGLGFAPDGRTMYLADTWRGARLVWAFDYDVDSGTPHGRRVFVDLHRHVGRPDGAAVDADGCYWICCADAGCVLRFDPRGRLDRRIDVPVKKPSMCAFGGARLDTLYITSIRPRQGDLSDQPHAGGLFVAHPGVTGLPEPAFDPSA